MPASPVARCVFQCLQLFHNDRRLLIAELPFLVQYKRLSMITESNLLSQLVLLFAPGLSPSAFRSRAGELLRNLVKCDVVVFAELDSVTRHLEVVFDPILPLIAEGLQGFGKHMAQYPCFSFDPNVNGGKPFLRSDFLTDEEFYSAPIYKEGFALGLITDHAAIPMPLTPKGIFFIGLELRGGTYRPEQRDIMTLLQPHLANAFLLAQDFSHLEQATADPAVFERAGLSQQQAQVLRWLAAGKTNPEISTIMELKPSTVKAYVQTVFDKLGVGNRHAALVRAHEIARERADDGVQVKVHSTYALPLEE